MAPKNENTRTGNPKIKYGPSQKPWAKQTPDSATVTAPSENPLNVYPSVPPPGLDENFPELDYQKFVKCNQWGFFRVMMKWDRDWGQADITGSHRYNRCLIKSWMTAHRPTGSCFTRVTWICRGGGGDRQILLDQVNRVGYNWTYILNKQLWRTRCRGYRDY
jgi:hypothetical protein